MHALHPEPYTLHPTPYTLHPTPYTLHPTPYTLHPDPVTPLNGIQDAWIWRAPMPPDICDIDFKLGKPGCDNRFAYELRAVGVRVSVWGLGFRV